MFRTASASLVVLLSLALSPSARAEVVAWYDFEGNLNDTTANPAGLGGTYFGGAPTFGAGFNGQGIVFDGGNNNAMTVPINLSPDMTPSVTIGAWVNTTSTAFQNVFMSDGDFGRRLVLSDQSANSGGNRHYTAFTGRDFSNGFNANQAAPPVKLVTGADGWVFLAASYNGPDRSVEIVAGNDTFTEPLAYPGQSATFSYASIGATRVAGGAIFEEFIGTLDNVFVIRGAASQAQLESIRDAANPLTQAQTVAAQIEAAGPTRTYGIDFSDAAPRNQGGVAILATGMLGNESWNDVQVDGGNNLPAGPIALVDLGGNLTGAAVDFSLVTDVDGGFNCAGCGNPANAHAQAGQDGFFRIRGFNDQHPDAAFLFTGLDPDATYRLTGIGSWNFNEFAEIGVDTDGDGILDTYEVVRPFSGAIRSIGEGGTQDIAIVPAPDGSILASFRDAFANGNVESISGLILEEFAPAAPVVPEPSTMVLGLIALAGFLAFRRRRRA